MKRIEWTSLHVNGAWNPTLRAAFTDASGAYAIRHAKTKAVEYVGESHTGRGWTTLTRHFQDASGKFAKRNFIAGKGMPTFTRAHPGAYEAALWITSKGLRSKDEPGDQKASDEQARLIRRFDAEGHKLANIDDGERADDFSFGANAKRNPSKEYEAGYRAGKRERLTPRAAKMYLEMTKPIAAGAPNAEYDAGHRAAMVEKATPKENPGGSMVVLGWLVSIAYRAMDGRRHVVNFGPRKNPAVLAYRPGGAAASLVIVHRPMVLGASSAKGQEEYKRTHWGSPGTGERLVGSILAGMAAKLGTALEITYATEKGGDLADWHHTFGDFGALKAKKPFLPPMLHAATIKGRQLVRLSGGTYTVTEHGIVG